MLLRSVIIDDEQKGINSLKILIHEYIANLKVVAETTIANEAIELIENYKPEIVFLDIDMPEMNGFELLEKLNRRDFNLIFVTAHEEYALRALKNNAVDYFLKPIDHEDLQITINKIRNRLMDQQNMPFVMPDLRNYNLQQEIGLMHKNRITVSLKSSIESIEPEEVVYIEARSNTVNIHLVNTLVIPTSRSLREYEDQLRIPNSQFMRVHHSFIINLNNVIKYLKLEENILMVNNKKIPLSRSKKEIFYAWLGI